MFGFFEGEGRLEFPFKFLLLLPRVWPLPLEPDKPMVSIPTAVSLTASYSSANAFVETYVEKIVRQIETEAITSLTGKTFDALEYGRKTKQVAGRVVVLINRKNK